jgi:flagella basal body P-ring formation protein FlgA
MTLTILMLAAAMQGSPCLPVSGDTIQARDLAEAVPAFAALPAELSLGYAPAPGSTRILRAQDLREIASREGVVLEQEDDVCFEWRLRVPSEEEFRGAMAAAIGRQGVSIEIVETSRYPAPPGDLSFALSALRPPPRGDPDRAVLWKGYVEYGERRRFAVWARVRVAVDTTRVIAAKPIKAGETIERGQVEAQPCRCFPFGNDTAQTLEQVVGRVSRQPFQAGDLIATRSLDRPLDVNRGDLVKVEVRNGAAVIQAVGRAEARGRRGETILVRNEASGKNFHAKVAGPSRVELWLSEKEQ